MISRNTLHRRAFLKLAMASAMAQSMPLAAYAQGTMARRAIPGTDERLPVIGLGTSDEFERMPADGGKGLKAVLTTLAEYGGTLIDTAPGYGNAEQVIGELLGDLDMTEDMFISSKVRSRGEAAGWRSLERSTRLLDKRPLDLMMVHSLVDADTQLDNLERLRNDGRVRYIGITTSRSTGFDRMEALIRKRALDFVQVNYSPLEPAAADRVIPAAQDRGVAVMVNRAFVNGRYFSAVRGRTLPGWTAEFDCASWAQLSLKWILANPGVTCSLAATSNARHMADNAAAGVGRLPDASARARISQLLQDL